MNVVTVGEFKANFSQYLREIENKDQEIIISYGKNHRKVAVLIPYKSSLQKQHPRQLGLLKKKGSFSLSSDFKIDDAALFRL